MCIGFDRPRTAHSKRQKPHEHWKGYWPPTRIHLITVRRINPGLTSCEDLNYGPDCMELLMGY